MAYDFGHMTRAYNSAIGKRNEGGFWDDDEVSAALVTVVESLEALETAIARAQARRTIADAQHRIEGATAFLKVSGEKKSP